MRILITSGGTKAPIDSVRHVDNMSSGRFGAELAREALLRGHEVLFLHATRSHTPLEVNRDLYGDLERGFDQAEKEFKFACELARHVGGRLRQESFFSYDQYADAVEHFVREWKPDVAVMAAAVSDYAPEAVDGKLSSSGDITLVLKPVAKVIDVVKRVRPETKLVGFKLLSGATEEALKAAADKVFAHADSDLVVGNDINQIRSGNHKITFFYADGRAPVSTNEHQARAVINEVEALSTRPKILLGLSGSVAAVLAEKLKASLQELGEVKVIATESAAKLAGDAFRDAEEWLWRKVGDPILHIELRRWADVLVLAPLSANTLAKVANGLADNLLTSTARAWDDNKPVVVAPAMNTAMWEQWITSQHITALQNRGIQVVPPVSKDLPCGESGLGALAEIRDIQSAVKEALSK